ncbi:hypothetical protein DITRI_Ditri10aG0041700 [Diplodiscus trichospermus]
MEFQEALSLLHFPQTLSYPSPPSSTVLAPTSPPAFSKLAISQHPLPLFYPRRRLSVPKAAVAATLNPEQVAKTLSGTAVYTVSNSNNEFVIISDPNGAKSIGLLCFRQEDAEAFLARVRLGIRELRSNAKVVPITLDEIKADTVKSRFDGVPVFQSDLLTVRKKNKCFCPIYFNKEDIGKELSKVSRVSRGPGVSQRIMVGSLEDVLKKMEMSEKNSGWEDLIFISPSKSYYQQFHDMVKVRGR